jgi:hypothetical protein
MTKLLYFLLEMNIIVCVNPAFFLQKTSRSMIYSVRHDMVNFPVIRLFRYLTLSLCWILQCSQIFLLSLWSGSSPFVAL